MDRSRWLMIGLAMAVGGLLSAPRTQAASTPLQFDPNGNLAAVGGIPSGPPVVRTGPTQVAAAPGEPLALTLSILSAEPTTIQWQIDGVDIPGATQATLLLPAVDASRTGAYRAVVRNASGTTAGGTLNVFLDADRDGLGDSWETTYFANLTAQSGWFDADTDGVSNLDEFREGTHPNDNRSYHPRLTVRSARGRVQIDPWLPYYTNNQPVTLTAFPDPGQTFIAFTSQTRDFTVCIVRAEGGDAIPLVSGEDPSWAPNSRALIFCKGPDHEKVLSLLDVPTKHVKTIHRILESNSYPSWAK